MKIYVETERFFLREILPIDVDGLYELDSDPEVHRYLGNNPVKNTDQIIEVINFVRQQYLDNGIGRWAIIDKGPNTFMGWTGLKLVKEMTNNHVDYYDLGYRIIRKYWGRGIATECAFASLNYAFDNLKTNHVYGTVDCENEASNKVLKKVGFNFIEQFDSYGRNHNWYSINRVEFEIRRRKLEKS